MGENVSCDARLVARWEDGEVQNPRPVYRRILASEIGRPYDQLGFIARTPPGASSYRAADKGSPGVGEVMEAVLSAEVLAALSDSLLLPVDATRSLDQDADLRVGVLSAWRLRQRAEYTDLGAMLPALLAGLRRASDRADGDEVRLEAITLLVHGLNATSSLLKKAGEFSLALLAADRAVETSRGIDDPVLTAAATHRLVNVLLPAGRLDECWRVALSAADSIQPGETHGVRASAMWGGLLLTAAVAAARKGDGSAAWELMGEARTAGRLVGRDHADLHTIFGPTNIALHGVQVAVELRDGRDALRRSERVRLNALPPDLVERRGQYLVDLTAGSVMAGDLDRASDFLFEAEATAPQEVRFSPVAHDALSMLLSRGSVGASSPLRELASRIAYGG